MERMKDRINIYKVFALFNLAYMNIYKFVYTNIFTNLYARVEYDIRLFFFSEV